MPEIKFKRNNETGEIEAYKDGKKVGEVKTMGDETNEVDVKQNDNPR